MEKKRRWGFAFFPNLDFLDFISKHIITFYFLVTLLLFMFVFVLWPMLSPLKVSSSWLQNLSISTWFHSS